MTLTPNPTYLLAPNWTFRPEGPIALGNIIADPFRPHRYLSRLEDETINSITIKSVELNWKTETQKVRNLNVSLWTRILDVARLDLGVSHGKTTKVALEMSQLETIYLAHEPSVDEIMARARDPRVHAVLGRGARFRRGTVYMITGLKIARGFKMGQSASKDIGAHVGAEGTVLPELGVGGNLEHSRKTRDSNGFEAANDIIFAYQLLRIRTKGRGENKTLEVDEFNHAAAFLNKDEENKDDKPLDLETDVPSLVDLSEVQKDLTVNPDINQYAWLFGGD